MVAWNKVTSLDVSNSILKRGFEDGIEINPMKLQRLLYLVYREYYKKTNQALFNERFELWKYGPVATNVHEKFKKYGINAIKEFYTEGDTVLVADELNSKNFKMVIDEVWSMYKLYSATALSDLLFSLDVAVRKAYRESKKFIKDEDIV